MSRKWWPMIETTLLCAIVLVADIRLIHSSSTSSSSRLLESHELLVGPWAMNIKWTSTQRGGRECTLHVFRNSTCVLQPKKVLVGSNNNSNSIINTGPFTNNNTILRGHWTVHKNPYCATDRFYDTVEFTLFAGTNDGPSSAAASSLSAVRDANNASTDDRELSPRTILLVGRCRLMGHFSPGRFVFFRAGARRRGGRRGDDVTMPFGKGRLTHGVFHAVVARQPPSVDADDAGAVTSAQQPIVAMASFVGQRSIASEDSLYELDEAEDRRVFGY
jgi:hypothetical protein